LTYLNQRIEKKVASIGADWINLAPYGGELGFSARNQLLVHVASNWLEGCKDLLNIIESFRPDTSFVENRGEVIERGASFHLFGSYNVDGVRKLIQFLHSGIYTSNKLKFDTTVVSFSSRSIKDLKAMMKMLKG